MAEPVFCRYLLLALTVFAHSVAADIYRWEDAAGTIHYGDRAVPGAQRIDVVPGYGYYRAEKVFDGDTLLLVGGEKVRLLGINTPEVESRYRIGEVGGEAAKDWLVAAVEGKKVRLEADVERRDKYRRLLAHVFDEAGVHLNLELVRRGLAVVDIHPPNLKYSQALVRAERQAENKRLGIWDEAAYAAKPVGEQASTKVRHWSRFVGIPQEVGRGRRYDRLIFDPRFSVHIPRENLSLFPKLSSYLGKRLEVRGWPSRRGQHFSVLVRHPSSLVPKE